MSYPIIADYCPDLPMMVDTNVSTDDKLQTGIAFSYQNFKFVEAADNRETIMQLKCSVISQS